MTKTLKKIQDQIGSHEIFDKVETRPMFLEGGVEVPFKKAVVKSSDGTPVAVVGNKYRLIQTSEVMERFAESIDDSGLDTNGLSIDVSMSPNAIRNIVKFTFPEHSLETKKGDITNLQICNRNSHDGTWLSQIDVGGFRIACANGQVFGDFISAHKARHTTGISFDDMAEGLGHSIEMFEQAGERWIQYKRQKVNQEQGQNIVLDYLGKTFDTVEERVAILDRKSGRRDQMIDKLEDYSKDMGRNVLAAYNTLTDDATHGKDDAMTQFDRSKRAARVIEAHYTQLAA
jgi:hypothetical protein